MDKEKYKKIFIIYIATLLYLLFLSRFRIYNMLSSNHIINWERINLVPLSTIHNYIYNYGYFRITDVIINLLGNVVVFIPFGYLLPQINAKAINFYYSLRIIFLFTISVEICQLLLKVGVCDIDDVILNSIGGVLGYSFYYFLKKIKKTLNIS